MKILHNIIFFSSLTASTQNSSFFAKWCLRRRFFFLFLSKNFEPLLWFHSSPGDHNFNKLESFLHYNVSIQAPAFLAQRFRRRKIIIFLILCKTSNPHYCPTLHQRILIWTNMSLINLGMLSQSFNFTNLIVY